MPAAVPLMGTNAKVEVTPIVGGVAGTAKVLKNSKWSLKPKVKIGEAPNTTDGMLRAVGLTDYDGTVDGFLDESDAIEGDIREGTICKLKLYRDATHFWECQSVIIGDFSDETGINEDPERWSFSFMRQSGALVAPIYT
jgi:hypothetical protein